MTNSYRLLEDRNHIFCPLLHLQYLAHRMSLPQEHILLDLSLAKKHTIIFGEIAAKKLGKDMASQYRGEGATLGVGRPRFEFTLLPTVMWTWALFATSVGLKFQQYYNNYVIVEIEIIHKNNF